MKKTLIVDYSSARHSSAKNRAVYIDYNALWPTTDGFAMRPSAQIKRMKLSRTASIALGGIIFNLGFKQR